jgi:hypothetical protein
MIANPSGTASNITTTTTLYSSGSCRIIGFYVNSTSSGTIVFADSNGSTSTTLSGTITPAVGYHAFPASCSKGIVVTIANTLNVTVFWDI